MKTLLLSATILLTAHLRAQSADTRSFISAKSSSTGVILTLTDKDGKPFDFGSSDLEGNPFLNEQWTRANLRLTNGRVYKGVKARLNIYNNYLHFMNDKGKEMYLEANDISRVEMLDSLKTDSVVRSFVKLTASENGKDASCFYEVRSEGKIMLLQRLRKKIKENKSLYSGEIKRFYEQYEDYYVFAGNELSPVKRKASFWETLMQDKWSLVESFANKNDLGFKSLEDLDKIVDYYNTLF
jgi:hypothetical protein